MLNTPLYEYPVSGKQKNRKQKGFFTMISQPGDKRMALIAVLIAVPVSALITMGVHTFVKNGDTAVSYPQQTGFSAQQKGGHRHHGSGMSDAKKEEFRKRFMEYRKARGEMQQKLAKLYKQRMTLMQNDKKVCPVKLLKIETEALISEASLMRGVSRLATRGEIISFTAVRAVTAEKTVELDKAAFKAGKIKKDTMLENEISSLKLQLQLTGSRLQHDPEWKAAYASYRQKPGLEALKGMLEAELEAARRTARHRR